MRRYPLSFIALTTLGVLCAIPGLLSLAGMGASMHPVLDDPMAGLAFIVSAVALIGSSGKSSGWQQVGVAGLSQQASKSGWADCPTRPSERG